MAVADSTVFLVDVVDGATTVVVPGEPGKRIRVWRAILTFDGPDGEKGVMEWNVGPALMTEFFVQSGDRNIMGYEALAWSTGSPGEPLTLSVDANISIKGTIRSEYVV